MDSNENNGHAMVSTAAILLALTWMSVVLRSYTRSIVMKCFQLDDWLMLVSQAIYSMSCAFVVAGVKHGMGRHNLAITNEDDKTTALMYQALATATYVVDMMFIKLSIGVFLLRLSVQRVYQYIIWTSLIVITVWSVVIFLWDILQCHPVAKQWDYRVTGGHCVAPEQVVSAAYAISVMTILSDWLFALLPIFMLWNVRMTRPAKATVIIILGLGIFASVATLVRLRFLADLEDTEDLLYAGTDAMVWTLIEPGVAIVASSLATIRPLLRALKVRGFESAERTHSGGHGPEPRRSFLKGRPPRPEPPTYGLDDLYLNDIGPIPNTIRDAGSPDGETRSPVRESCVSVERVPSRCRQTNRHSAGSKTETIIVERKSLPLPPCSPPRRSALSGTTIRDQSFDIEAQRDEIRLISVKVQED